MNEITVDYNFDLPSDFDTELAKDIVKIIFEKENYKYNDISVVFVSDEFLKNLHSKYLNKDQNTDVITFDLTEEGMPVSGEIYISVERAKAQAVEYEVTTVQELYRYVIHGTLHLCGFDDLKDSDRELMKNKEEMYLKILSKLN